MTLIERIDIALQHAGKSRAHLAQAIGLTPAAFTNLQRRPGSRMEPQNVARVARYLRADIYWMCTGEGGEYVPEVSEPEFSLLARDAAAWLDAMSDDDRWKAFGMLNLMTRGHWPVFHAVPAQRGNCAPDVSPTSSHPSANPHQTHP